MRNVKSGLRFLTGFGLSLIFIAPASSGAGLGRKSSIWAAQQTPDVPVAIDNSERPPVLIEEAVGGDETTARDAERSRSFALRRVRLANASARRVSGIDVCLARSAKEELHCVRKDAVELGPGERLTVSFDEEGGWLLPGVVKEYTARVLSVRFADGGEWVTKR